VAIKSNPSTEWQSIAIKSYQEQSRAIHGPGGSAATKSKPRGTPSHLRVRIARVGERPHLLRQRVVLLLGLPRLRKVTVLEVDDRLAQQRFAQQLVVPYLWGRAPW
jgi:hypothetical protein